MTRKSKIGVPVTSFTPAKHPGRYQYVPAGGESAANQSANRVRSFPVDCPECGGKIWVGPMFLKKMRGNPNRKRCVECRSKSRREGFEAALAVAERKKKMGIKW